MFTSRVEVGVVRDGSSARSRRASFTRFAPIVFAVAGVIARVQAAPTFTSAVQLQTPVGAHPLTEGSVFIWDSVSAGYGAAGHALFSNSRAVRWAADGSPTVLGDVQGLTTTGSEAHGINNAGQTVGSASWVEHPDSRAVRWQADGSAVVLGDVLGVTTRGSSGYGINNLGQAAGIATLVRSEMQQDARAVRWAADGSAMVLGEVPGLGIYRSIGYGINDLGQVVGYAQEPSDPSHRTWPVRWEVNGSATILADPPGPTPRNIVANAINSSGVAVGLMGDFDPQALRWSANGSATLLGGVPGVQTYDSAAYGITDTGLIAGFVSLYPAPVGQDLAVIWDASGTATFLQDLMADGNTWKFTTALGIDADETTIRVAAYGSKNGGPDQFYLLTAAVPEPTGALLVVGAPLLLRRRTNELRGKSE